METQFVLKVEGVIDHGQQPGLSLFLKNNAFSKNIEDPIPGFIKKKRSLVKLFKLMSFQQQTGCWKLISLNNVTRDRFLPLFTTPFLIPFHMKGNSLFGCYFVFSGLYRDVQSICLSVTWRAEDKKQQVLDGKVCIFWCQTSDIFGLPQEACQCRVCNTLVPEVDCRDGFFRSFEWETKTGENMRMTCSTEL